MSPWGNNFMWEWVFRKENLVSCFSRQAWKPAISHSNKIPPTCNFFYFLPHPKNSLLGPFFLSCRLFPSYLGLDNGRHEVGNFYFGIKRRLIGEPWTTFIPASAWWTSSPFEPVWAQLNPIKTRWIWRRRSWPWSSFRRRSTTSRRAWSVWLFTFFVFSSIQVMTFLNSLF